MTKHRNILSGSLLLLILAGAMLALSRMKQSVAMSPPFPHSSTTEPRNNPPVETTDVAKESKPQEDIQASLEREWERLTTTEFCFLGSDDYRPGREDDEKSFNPFGWLPSAKKNLDSAITFLLERISNERRTKAHVCPFDKTTEGELAVYSLQHILKKNWYELNKRYKRRYEHMPEDITAQDLLRSIIQYKEETLEMIHEWKRHYEEKRHLIQI